MSSHHAGPPLCAAHHLSPPNSIPPSCANTLFLHSVQVETLPVHDESQEEIEETFNKYAAVCERDMEAIIGMVNAFKGCDMNMSNVVASSPLRRQNIMEKRIYRNRARTNKGQRGGLR